jgi:hypothetical protein
MLLLDIQDSRSVRKLRYDNEIKTLEGGAKLISSNEKRLLVRTFGVATEGRLCSVPKDVKLARCYKD